MKRNKRKIRRYKFRRFFQPTAELYRHAIVAVLGLLFLISGLVFSFRLALAPLVTSITIQWHQLLSQIIGPESPEVTTHILGGLLLVLGLYVTYKSGRGFMRAIVETVDPKASVGVVDYYVRKQQLAKGPRIVAVGGGTGLGTLLRGLKQYSSNITAIVTVTDDGGSSGRLVQELGIIPPGDLRNCLVALADAEKLMTDLFQHRFQNVSGSLSGHSIGNLLIAGFVEQANGDYDQALQMASEVLNIRGRVIPSTMHHVKLRAIMDDETEICGETAIVSSEKRVRRIFLEPENSAPHPQALEAIAAADMICIGPGSIFTSVIPNLLVPGIADAIAQSDAIKAYICNIMTQRGESERFTAAEHLVALEANVDRRVCDYVLVNTGTPTAELVQKYREYNQEPVTPDIERIRNMGYKPIIGDLMSESDYVRHDPGRVAQRLMGLFNR